MSITVAYGALLAGVILWLVLVRKLSAKSWEAQAATDVGAVGIERFAPARVGLWVFLCVVTSLFALFMSAYFMRMGHGHGADADMHDWHQLSEPKILWLNTAVLILGSIVMQWSRASLARGNAAQTRNALLTGGLLTMGFLVGQLVAWFQLSESGFFTPSDPAIAFFYLLTAVHGLHLVGGLVVWGRTLTRMRKNAVELIDVRLSVELCTVYWHYLLLVWLALFAMLLST